MILRDIRIHTYYETLFRHRKEDREQFIFEYNMMVQLHIAPELTKKHDQDSKVCDKEMHT